MERLTTNKEVSEMNMLELAMNCCHIRDRHVRYRDFETDVDARELTRKLLKKYAEGDDSFTDDLNFDEEMIDLLQYGTETIEGLIALFYRNMWAMAELREKLMEYENAEGKGLLCKLLCKVGSTVWDIDFGFPTACIITGYSFGTAKYYIEDPVTKKKIVYYFKNSTGSITGSFSEEVIGETIFLTKKEAEEALNEED